MRYLTHSSAAIASYSLGVYAQSGAQPLGLAYGGNSQPVTRDSDVVAQAFPNVEGIELLSPAFTEPESVLPGFSNGTAPPTSLNVLDNYIRVLAERNDWMTYVTGDFLSEEGRAMPYLYLTTSNLANPPECPKLRVYIQAAIHGNEPAAEQSVLALLGKMDANQTWAQSLLQKMDIKILPLVNPDGVEYFQRQFANNFDANREHIKLFRQASRDVKRVFSEFDPHVSLDFHEYTASSIFGGDYQHAADSMDSPGTNLNIAPEIRTLALDKFVPAISEGLQSYGLRWETYVVGASNETSGSNIRFVEAVTEPRTSWNALGLTQTVSFLLETRGIRLADQHFQRRVATALIKASSLLELVRDDYENIYSTIEGARENFVNSTQDIVVTEYYPETERTYTLVDRANGSVVQVPVEFESTTPSVANLTRARPEAYLVPRTYHDVVEKLRILGVEVEQLDYEYRGTVQAMNITSNTVADQVYEGTVLNSVTTESYETDVHLPSGSYMISTRQKNAAFAFVALEPESIDSYVRFNIIQVSEADQYPVFRIMK